MSDVITITVSAENRAALEELAKQERIDDIIKPSAITFSSENFAMSGRACSRALKS